MEQKISKKLDSKKDQDRYYNLISRRAKLRLTASPITETIGAMIGVLLLWVGGLDVLVYKIMNSEDFIRFILIMFSILAPIRLLSNVGVEIQSGIASAERVFNILDTKSDITEKINPIELQEFKSEIDLKMLAFFMKLAKM